MGLELGPARNRYLVTRSGRFVGTRLSATALFFGPLVASPVVGVLGGVVGSALGIDAIIVVAILAAVLLFIGAVVAQWVFLLTGSSSVERASAAVRAGDTTTPLALCHRPLATVFRADVRTGALHVLGLCAQGNADFGEAADLFDRSSRMIPAMAAGKWQRHARVIILSHRAVALVALGRLDEADMIVRQASQLFPPRPPGALDVLTDDAAFGAIGVSKALRDIEQGRDPRALLTLASVAVLAARGMGREAAELIERERYSLNAGLLPRERALVARVEARAHRLLAGGPMRSVGIAPGGDPASDAWAERVFPSRD
jgi:hypothetical protein